MYNGILPVYKERGLTSHDVVFKLRKILKTKKIGHTGTLDPEVSGVLPICIGTATRVSDYVMDMGKSYQATITLGESTTTEDQTGEVIEKVNISSNTITSIEVDRVLEEFKGVIEQIPPMYSSVKVNGKKLYEYARKGETIERPKRQVKIDEIERISDLTFIRTLATDIGKALGYPAHMSLLTRINSGGFNINESLSLEKISELHEHETLQHYLFPIEYGLKSLQHVVIDDDTLKYRILNGQKLLKKDFTLSLEKQFVFIDKISEKALAIYEHHPDKINEIKPKKVFN